MSSFGRNIRPHVDVELQAAAVAENRGRAQEAFGHLERAHVLGQASTREHVRVHWAMFCWGVRSRDLRECAGQIFRIVGAATKTVLGWIPDGNTGGSNVSPFRRMPLAPELARRIDQARARRR